MRAHGWLLLLVCALSGCFSPSFEDGHLKCAANNVCPPGFHCATDLTCWKNGDDPIIGPDMSTGVPISYTASTIWTSCGGGEGLAPSGAQLNLSFGGSLVSGRSTAASGANVTYGYFGDQAY
jgi:hypothetical protein